MYFILGYSNRQLVARASILNKKKSSAGIFGDFSPGYLVGTHVTFLKNSAFYIFIRFGMIFELMLLDYS